MENRVNGLEQLEELEEDTLSLCNLAMQESGSSANQSPRANPFSAQELFEFSNELSSPEFYHSAPDIIFCGKIIQEEEELNEYQKRDYLATVRSHSLRKPPSYDGYPFLLIANNETEEPKSSTTKSGSLRISSSSKAHNHSSSHHHHHVQKVNITSLTSMSAKSRRRMFMFGPVKFKPEMELSAIKERQGRRLTTLLSPVTVVDGGKAVVNDGRKPPSPAGEKRNHSYWGVVKSTLSGRAHLSSVLSRSFGFGCLPFHAAATRNWIHVAN